MQLRILLWIAVRPLVTLAHCNVTGVNTMRKILFFLIGLAVVTAATPDMAVADLKQDFIIARINEQYQGFLRQAGGDAAKKAKLMAIRKQTIKKVQSKPGLGGHADAEAGVKQMQDVVK